MDKKSNSQELWRYAYISYLDLLAMTYLESINKSSKISHPTFPYNLIENCKHKESIKTLPLN